MSAQAAGDDEGRLVSLVPEDGSPIGNKRLRSRLGWDSAQYFDVRDPLVQAKILAIGRGRGGSVYRVTPISVVQTPPESAKPAARRYKKEKDLYRPIMEALRDGWSKMLSHQNYLVQITGMKGKKATGGMWTQPDVTVVAVDTYAYVPGKIIEVITYEIKPAGGWSVAGVFEAASHSRFATQTYLLIHAPEGEESIPEGDLERLKLECVRFKIGLGLFRDPPCYDTYDILVEPERRQPDPAEMNRFILQQITDSNRGHLSRWLR